MPASTAQPMPIQECPDILGYDSTFFQASAIPATTLSTPLLYCERDTILEAAFGVITGALSVTTPDSLCTLEYLPDLTAPASSVAITSAVNTDTATLDTTLTFPLLVDAAGVPTANIIPANSILLAKFDRVPTSLDAMTIMIRTRTKQR